VSTRRIKPATYDDLRKLPENMVGEIIDGELFASPRPAPPHAQAASMIGVDLGGPFNRQSSSGGLGGWWIIDEPEIHFRADVIVPDLGGWRRDRMPRLPSTAAFELAPDWVCEILSPSTARIDRVGKPQIYRREKVGHMWVVDPLARTLEAYRLNSGQWTLIDSYSEDARVRVEPFEAIELDLARWWAEVDNEGGK
jgi:Uma2 family endonuclease